LYVQLKHIFPTRKRPAITTTVYVIILVAIIISAAVVAAYSNLLHSPTPGITNSSVTSVSQASTTLVVDDFTWPIGNLNQLNAVQFLPWPNWMYAAMYQPIIDVDVVAQQSPHGTLNFLPGLAQAWQSSPDGMTWKFYLRQNVTFSNGDPFNAYQLWTQFYILYELSGNVSTFLGGVDLFDVSQVSFGPQTVQMLSRANFANPSADVLAIMEDTKWPIYVADPYTLVFHLSGPFNFVPGLLVGFEGEVFDAKWVLQNGGFGSPGQVNPYFNDHPIPGTGPYMITQLSVNQYVKFERNPNYWGKYLSPAETEANPLLDPGHVDTVIVYVKTSTTARYVDLVTGEAQISAITESNWPLISSNPNYAYATYSNPAKLVAIFFNTHKYPTNISNIRRAIVHAINYSEIIDRVFFGQGVRIMGPETPVYGKYYDPGNVPPYEYNLTLAKEFMAKAGFPNGVAPNGTSLPPLSFYVDSTRPSQTTAAEIVQANLADIGIDVQITAEAAAQLYGPLGSYENNVINAAQIPNMQFWWGFAPDYLAPTDFWGAFVTSFSLWGNGGAYSNPTVDKDVRMLSQTTDQTKVIAALTEAQMIIANDAPIAWIAACKLALSTGSYAWPANLITQAYMDPNLSGVTEPPILNTVVLARASSVLP
jgi:peptide/nickel transport system substrate-binding protein